MQLALDFELPDIHLNAHIDKLILEQRSLSYLRDRIESTLDHSMIKAEQDLLEQIGTSLSSILYWMGAFVFLASRKSTKYSQTLTKDKCFDINRFKANLTRSETISPTEWYERIQRVNSRLKTLISTNSKYIDECSAVSSATKFLLSDIKYNESISELWLVRFK